MDNLGGRVGPVIAVNDAIDQLGETEWYSVLHRGRWTKTLQLLERYAPVQTHRRVLDVGVWPGYQSVAIAKLGYEIRGLDLQPNRLPALPFEVEAVDLNIGNRWPVADHSMDVVVATEIIEHLVPEQVTHVMVEAQRVLRPGGIILITTPNRFHLGATFHARVRGTDTEGHGHTKEYTVDELRKLVSRDWNILVVRAVDVYSGVGKISNHQYYRPLRQLFQHPRRLHNILKAVGGTVQWIFPWTRDTVILVAQTKTS